MLVAAAVLRRAISEDGGIVTYADWLEMRVEKLVEGLVNGGLDLPGVDPDESAPASGSIAFYPTQQSTDLWEEEGDVEGAAALHFDSQKVF